jgi:hypothetical protein
MKKFEVKKCNLKTEIKGIDYEILTIEVIDSKMNFLPYGRVFRTNIKNIIQMERQGKSVIEIIDKQNTKRAIFSIEESRPPISKQDFYIIEEDMLDHDTAIDCGFGIIRMLKGVHKGNYFLYNCENEEENIPFMLDVYLQIAVKKYDNKSLERLIDTKSGRQLLKVLKHTDDNALLHKLDMVFQSKKGGDNILTFSREN